MEAVRPKSKSKSKKKSKAKTRGKTGQVQETSSEGACATALPTPITMETEEECVPEINEEELADQISNRVSNDGTIGTMATKPSSLDDATGGHVMDISTSDADTSSLRPGSESVVATVAVGDEAQREGGSLVVTEHAQRSEDVGAVIGREPEIPVLQELKSVDLDLNIVTHPTGSVEVDDNVEGLNIVTHPTGSVEVDDNVVTAAGVGVELLNVESESANLITTTTVGTNQIMTPLPAILQEETTSTAEQAVATATHQPVDTQQTANVAEAPLTVSVETRQPVTQTDTRQTTIITETQQTVSTQLPSVAVETAEATPPMTVTYPPLESLRMVGQEEEELMEHLVPFTEEDLSLLYPNRQVECHEVLEDAFIRESSQEHHPLYELLSLYLKARQALITAQAHLQDLKNEYNTHKPLLWKFENQTITSSARCGDRVKVSQDHTFKKAVFNPVVAVQFNDTLTQTRDVLKEELSMKFYSSQLAHIHIEHFLFQLVNSLPLISHLNQDHIHCSFWIPQLPPGCLDTNSSQLRDAISVLFMFERRPQRDKKFSQDCRAWLNMLMSILLRVASLSDHQFIQHHLLRCPPGVSQWATAYLQVCSPLNTTAVLDAQFSQRDHHSAYDWGVGMGLHSDWGGPLLDYFVSALATLLLPIKQRREFLAKLDAPLSSSEEGQRWTFVEDDLEAEDEENKTLLKESDYISFFEQFPFSEVFQHILKIGANGELPVAETTSHQMLRLIAFSTSLVRLLGAAFSTLRQSRYKEFVKQVGRTIRQTVQYVADQWCLYRSHRVSCGDRESHLPFTLSGDGQGRYSLNRLQLEFDQFVQRAASCILTAHRLGAWQFLADMPYDTISLRAIWSIFYCIYSNQITVLSGGDERSRTGHRIPASPAEIIAALKDHTLQAQFVDLLLKTFTSESVFLLTTFANMARARRNTSTDDREFISTIALEIFEVTQVMEFSNEVYARTGASLLDSIAIEHPFIISILIGRISEVVGHVGENCVSVARELPLNIWTPTSTDLDFIRQWLVGAPLQSDANKLARVLLGELNWGRRTEDGSNSLVLDWWVHRTAALMIVESHSLLLPHHPGGREYSSKSTIAKYKSTLQRMTMSQEERDYVTWSWEVLLMLKIHPNQVIRRSMEVLTPEPRTPESCTPESRGRTGFTTSAKDVSIYRRQAEPEWAGLTPDSDDIILPDLSSCSERELAELRVAMTFEGTLAAYTSLCLSSLGSDTDHFLKDGLPQLQRLIDEGYFLPALRAIANITPRFFRHKKILLETPGFLQAVYSVANADSLTASLRDRLLFITPQPNLLRKMAGLLHTQLQSGRSRGGGVSGDVILQFWLNIFLSYPSWHKDQSLLYLLNTLCLASFTETSWHKFLISALLEGYHALGPLQARRGLFSPVLSFVSSSSPPSIFTSVSIREYPWLAFFALCAEQQFEEKEGIWKELLKQLKKDSKISIDNALKKAFSELKTPQGYFSSPSLSIYRWAEFCSSMEPGHPIVPLVWQKFFSLYLQRPVLESSMPERGSLGLRFFAQSRTNTQRRQMKSSLTAVCMKLQSQIDRGRRESEGERREGEGGEQYLSSTLGFFQMLNLWLEEPRLHDDALYLPGLPRQYGSQRLATIFSASDFQFWMEFVPVWKVKGQQLELIDEWLQVESYQKTLPSNTPQSTPDNALTRIQKRLGRCKPPVVPPPTLQVISAPFERLTEEILLTPDSLVVILRGDIQFVVQQASAFCTRYNALVTLDNQYMQGVSELYGNVPRQFQVRVPCRSRLRTSHHCANPATITFMFSEMQVSHRWEQQLTVNRSEYDDVISSLSFPLTPALCNAVMRMEHTVGELSRLSEQLPDTERARAIQSGVNLFYEILASLSADCRVFPPTCQFLTSCVQILGQEFIQRDPSQTVRVLDCLMKQPRKADLLVPLFHPNNCPTQFLEMYGNVATVAKADRPNVAFSVLTKFSVSEWLEEQSASLGDRVRLLEHIWRGIIFCGPKPSTDFEILLEGYKKHLKNIVDYQFPELVDDLLRLLVEAIDNAQVTPTIWTTVSDILTLNKEHPKTCQLGLRQCLDIATFLSQHYMNKRSVTRETLYSQLSWEYLPALGHFLSTVCVTLTHKWEESVSMATTTYQDAILGWWRATVDVFAPWISSLQLSAERERETLAVCLESETGIMGTEMECFVECVHVAHNRLKDPAQRYNIMALLWEYYCTTLANYSPSLPVLRVYHAHLVNLPWNEYFPDLAAIEAMMKLKLMDYYSPSSFVFLGAIFPRIEWRSIVSAYCDGAVRGTSETPIQLHMMLLQLLVMLAAEDEVMQKQDTTIPEVIADAHTFNWQYIDSKTYSDILEWQRNHFDPGMVLETGSCLSLSLRLLKAAAGFPFSDGTTQELHPETWEKRRSYVEAVVNFISQASQKKENQNSNFSDIVSHLFQTTLDVYMQVSESAEQSHIVHMIQSILTLFNTCSLFGGVRQKIVDIIYHILDEMPSVHFLSLPLLSAACNVVADIPTLVKILEKCIETHFKAILVPTSKTLALPQDPNGYGWHGITSNLSLPQSKAESVCRAALVECTGLVLHAHLLEALPQSTSLQQEFRIAIKAVQWVTQLKPKSTQEPEVFLIWEKATSLLLRQIQYGTNPLEVVPHLTAMATCLVRLGEDKASEGLLGVIGLGKKSTYSHQFRLISRAMAAFLYCQMPIDVSQKTHLRTIASAPGHVKDPHRPSHRSGSLHGNPAATKLADTSLHQLETLLTNKHYAHLKDKVTWCVEYVIDPIHSVMDTTRLLVELCTSLYPEYRFLDILRIL